MSSMEKAAYNLAQRNAIAMSSTLAGNFPEGVIQDADLDPLGIRTTVTNNSTNINNKIKSMIYNASTTGVTNIIHGLNYDPVTDELNIVDLDYGSILTKDVEYSENINNISIDLLAWSLNSGDKLKIQVIKGVK